MCKKRKKIRERPEKALTKLSSIITDQFFPIFHERDLNTLFCSHPMWQLNRTYIVLYICRKKSKRMRIYGNYSTNHIQLDLQENFKNEKIITIIRKNIEANGENAKRYNFTIT